MARKRKAILYCSGILGLALVANCNLNIEHDPREPNRQQQPLYGTVDQVAFTPSVSPANDYVDHGAQIYSEATRILALAPFKRDQRKFEKARDSPLSILSSELFRHRGIIPTTIRHVTQSFASAFSSSSTKDKSSSSSSTSAEDKASSDSAKDEKPKEAVPRHDNPKIANALDILHEAAMEYNNDDALLTLANIYFNGQYKTQRDLTRAFDYYAALADRSGNATAQQMVGFMYSTGIGGAVERSEQRALLYTWFAASANDTAAQMTLGYKHLLGIGTTKSCERAIHYYRQTADRAFRKFKDGPPGGRTLPPPKTRLTDREGGTYGPGASHHGPSTSQKDIQEFLEFNEKFTADGDSAQARQRQYELGVLYYTGIAGSISIDRDYRKAGDNLHKFADSFFHGKWREKLTQTKEQRRTEVQDVGIAAALLGKMYWRGEGFEVDEKKAREWFERGVALDNPIAMNGLGCMYRDGVAGLTRDLNEAKQWFYKAANKASAEAQVNYGHLLLAAGQAYHPQARQAFEQAATAYNFEAYYYLGDMYQHGIGGHADCELATKYFKFVTERGDWDDELLPGAFEDYQNGDIESAAIGYLLAAERGIEVGQSNFAWIIDRELPTSYYLSLLASQSASQTAAKLALAESSLARLGSPARLLEMALVFWARSANQGDVDARIKMGDYYFVGIGTEADPVKARMCYQDAVQDNSAQALWNLGWMYENGVGVVKDFFMAKKYYDLALSTSAGQAYLPVTLSLLKLNVRYMWNYMTGGDVGGAEGGLWSISGTSGQEAADDDTGAGADKKGGAAGGTQDMGSDVDSMGEKLVNARKKAGVNVDDEGNDLYGTDGHDFDEEEDLLDLVVIVGLFGVVAYLMYVRQFRFGGNQQQQQQQQQQQEQQAALGANGQPIAGLPGDPHNPGRYAYAAAGG
ncbi:ERAD-associated protein [Actinomortierella ambigua]|nr:ERAD-associated protein [Actinomortierella ambigua]